jgi:hypothetical protein
MNVEIGAEAAQFPEKEYINVIGVAVQCMNVIPVGWAFLWKVIAANQFSSQSPWSQILDF